MKPSDSFLQELYSAELGPNAQAAGVRELLRRLFLLSNQPEKNGCLAVTVTVRDLAKIDGMRRYCVRSIRTWRRWAVDVGVLRVHIVEDGEWCGNSYFVDLVRLHKLAATNTRRAG